MADVVFLVLGCGLFGLPICRGIATAMGGTIRAESPAKDGKGTRLVVRLPAPETGLVKGNVVATTDEDLNDGTNADPGGR